MKRSVPFVLAAALAAAPAGLLAEETAGSFWEGVDHRLLQSPVKDQGERGTCTAFALVSALETFSGVPLDLSEQYLFAIQKSTQAAINRSPLAIRLGLEDPISEGVALSSYMSTLAVYGVPHEKILPYHGDRWFSLPDSAPDDLKALALGQATPQVLSRIGRYGKYHVAEHEVLDGDRAADCELIRQKLASRKVLAIPVGYLIHSGAWSARKKGAAAIRPELVIRGVSDGGRLYTYDEARARIADLPGKIRAGKLQVQLVDPTPSAYGGHAVTIVGYTDSAFIIKNSWGTGWGDDGYGYVSFDYHRIFARQAILIYSVRPSKPEVKSIGIAWGQFFLKCQVVSGGGSGLALSTYTLEEVDPKIDSAVYDVYEDAPDGGFLLKFHLSATPRFAEDSALAVVTPPLNFLEMVRRYTIVAQYTIPAVDGAGKASTVTAIRQYDAVGPGTQDIPGRMKAEPVPTRPPAFRF